MSCRRPKFAILQPTIVSEHLQGSHQRVPVKAWTLDWQWSKLWTELGWTRLSLINMEQLNADWKSVKKLQFKFSQACWGIFSQVKCLCIFYGLQQGGVIPEDAVVTAMTRNPNKDKAKYEWCSCTIQHRK